MRLARVLDELGEHGILEAELVEAAHHLADLLATADFVQQVCRLSGRLMCLLKISTCCTRVISHVYPDIALSRERRVMAKDHIPPWYSAHG